MARAGLQRRLYGGFDKIAGDDSSFEEPREMFAEDDPVAGPTLKEQMKGQVDEANKALDRMSHMLSRAARKAQLPNGQLHKTTLRRPDPELALVVDEPVPAIWHARAVTNNRFEVRWWRRTGR